MYTTTLGDRLQEGIENIGKFLLLKLKAKVERQEALNAKKMKEWKKRERISQETELFIRLFQKGSARTPEETELMSILSDKSSAESSLPQGMHIQFQQEIEDCITKAISDYGIDGNVKLPEMKLTLCQRFYYFFFDDEEDDEYDFEEDDEEDF